jgi:hypothetical protein
MDNEQFKNVSSDYFHMNLSFTMENKDNLLLLYNKFFVKEMSKILIIFQKELFCKCINFSSAFWILSMGLVVSKIEAVGRG